jgi:hypothetical protein
VSTSSVSPTASNVSADTFSGDDEGQEAQASQNEMESREHRAAPPAGAKSVVLEAFHKAAAHMECANIEEPCSASPSPFPFPFGGVVMVQGTTAAAADTLDGAYLLGMPVSLGVRKNLFRSVLGCLRGLTLCFFHIFSTG